jgi:hypothetical protein
LPPDKEILKREQELSLNKTQEPKKSSWRKSENSIFAKELGKNRMDHQHAPKLLQADEFNKCKRKESNEYVPG